MNDRIRRRRGGFELRIPRAERALLRTLPTQLRELLAEDDPSTARLFPPAYEEDADREAEYRAMTREDLVAGRLHALEVMEETADADRLDEEQLVAWLHALNDLRLVLGTKLDVSEDPERDALLQGGPEAESYAVYSYLGWLVEQAVEALSSGPGR
jgi:uncharacterized protein DUF2017